jgi:hypothetical protein
VSQATCECPTLCFFGVKIDSSMVKSLSSSWASLPPFASYTSADDTYLNVNGITVHVANRRREGGEEHKDKAVRRGGLKFSSVLFEW